ncbi:invasion associated locus B family protein [Cognatiyoonia sp. IB215182]|uniref:invasion associated locus B family protein n=1 Tax=Cognatiyoonia sp. IB215182 TaxID=3097353 RepID=UPI002A168298|nr:invasion associated locus B family protein [Cognatiyoonia sp. IB215182]MDX8354529.1 invasion associated locus B family protein [Cognatiyoonia sp. IB215182]
MNPQLSKHSEQDQKRAMNVSMDRNGGLLILLRFSLIVFGFLMLPVSAFAQPTSATASGESTTVVAEQFEDWQHRCISHKRPDQTAACELSQSVQVDQDGRSVEVLNIALSRADDAAGSVGWALVVLTPRDVHLPSDFGLKLGNTAPFLTRYRNCNEAGCWVVVPADEAVLSAMKRGIEGAANFRLLNGQVVSVVFSLRGFTAGFEALAAGQIPQSAGE